MAEPMVSHDVIGFYLLSREVSKHVKVVQSGQGADEVFAGYHWYPPMLEVGNAEAVKTYASVFFDRDFEDYKTAVNAATVESYGDCKEPCVEDESHVKCKACMADVTIPAYCAGHEGTKGC